MLTLMYTATHVYIQFNQIFPNFPLHATAHEQCVHRNANATNKGCLLYVVAIVGNVICTPNPGL